MKNRLEKIRESKKFYYEKLKTADTELSKDLIEAKIEILESEEKTLKRKVSV